jgi:hypothetical protein
MSSGAIPDAMVAKVTPLSEQINCAVFVLNDDCSSVREMGMGT